MSSTHLSAQCRSTTPVVTAGIPQQNSPSLRLQENITVQPPSCKLPWTDRQTLTLVQNTTLAHCYSKLHSHIDEPQHTQLRQAPKTDVPQLGACVRSFVAKISNKQDWLAPPTHTPYHEREKLQGSTLGSYTLQKRMRLMLHKRALSTAGRITCLLAAVSAVLDICKQHQCQIQITNQHH